ncbi:peptidylprolyl isomerase [Aliiroseovarius sp. YM-037]|uniref:peptidylprolyl isomerase n=1 Tax=Aliiroseovarius sp. YM-037 TaxID=3341728 RepID=UPI003A806FEB
MRESSLFLGAVAILAAGGVAAWLYMGQTSETQVEIADGDTPGPNLLIEVAGSTEGTIVVDLLPNVAPNHVEQMTALAEEGAYNGVVFHRVIDGFMAQTGDVEHGKVDGDISAAGTGASDRPNIDAEFSNVPFRRGTVGMARSASPNSANSQFFIMFDEAPHLNGEYTVVGRVIEGMDVVDAIKKGDSARNGGVDAPDHMAEVTVAR